VAYPYEICNASDPTGQWVCTRRREHSGDHTATFGGWPDNASEEESWNRCCPDWPNDDTLTGITEALRPAATVSTPKRTLLASLPPELSLSELEGYATRTHVMLIGAGGVGARLAPLLVKHLIPGDALSIIDHDIVEIKNLQRQHFVADDIGKPKALVVAERAALAAPSPDVYVHGYQMKVEAFGGLAALHPSIGNLAAWSLPEMLNGRRVVYRIVVISAIDSRKGRNDIAQAVAHLRECLESSLAWIDCGNDMFSGQALVAALRAVLDVREVGQSRGRQRTCWFDGWGALAPSFLSTPDDADTVESCGIRVDTQSVMANAWAALSAATLAVPFITGAPITSLGMSFSIRSGGTKIVAVKEVTGGRYERSTLIPSGVLLA
jgi:hypothetical protein